MTVCSSRARLSIVAGLVHVAFCVCLLSLATAVDARSQGTLFEQLHQMLPPIPSVQAMALADVDGDGDGDLVVGEYGAQNRLYVNDGTGHFADATDRLPQNPGNTYALALGDVNGDGHVDLIVGNSGQSRLYLNDGSGRFLDAPGFLPLASLDTRALVLGDLDGDGDADLILGVAATQNRLYLNDGTGHFNDASAQLPADTDHERALALGDVDADGDLDLVAANELDYQDCSYYPPFCGEQDRLSLNDGSGHFIDATNRLPVDADPGAALALGDVDGDGDLDIVVANYGVTYCDPSGCTDYGYEDRLCLNDGAGYFTDATDRLPIDWSWGTSLALGDVDGDGDLDLLVGNEGQQDRLFLNDSAGFFSDATDQIPSLAGDTRAVVLGDLDADQDADLVIGGRQNTQLCLNDGAGSFTDVTGPLAVDHGAALALGDVDADGRLDLVTSPRSEAPPWYGGWGHTRLYLNRGGDRFVDASDQLPAVDSSTNVLALGDVDGDGDRDLVIGSVRVSWGHDCYGRDQLYLNDGSGRFADATDRLPWDHDPCYSTLSLALGDVDADGDADLVLGLAAPGPDGLYLNDGAGFFSVTPGYLPLDENATHGVALSDLNGDGHPDLILGDFGRDRLYRNDGTGHFIDFTNWMPADGDSTWAVTLGDVDRDGDLDVAFGNTGQDRLCLNDGNGQFSSATDQLPPDSDTTLAIVLADVDADGDLDLYTGNESAPDRLSLNDASGRFTDASGLLVPGPDSRALALGDVDGDGDADVVKANVGLNMLLTNLSHQLAWRAVPRMGKALTIDMYGAPWTRFVLSVGGFGAGMPTHPTAQIHAGMQVLGVGYLGRSGHAAYRCQIPADPSLVGRSWLWVAEIGGMRVLETTTFSDL